MLFYDLLVMGAGFLLNEKAANVLIFLSLFANPVDAARVAGLISAGDVTIFGAAGAALLKFFGGQTLTEVALIATMFGWTAGPLVVAGRILRRRDL